MSNRHVITVISDDRPGIVEQLARVISANSGNWLESSLSRLGGKFAGILLVEVDDAHREVLSQSLAALGEKGIRVAIEAASGNDEDDLEHYLLSVVGNDRPGIVGEISAILARHQVNVDELTTYTEQAPMSGELLFRISADIALPAGLALDALRQTLEQLSDDLMVELDDFE